jgi:xanthine dehydrogenase large subunit
MPPSDAVLEAPLRHVYKPLPHDSGAKHVQGSAEYIDDMPEPVGTMHIAVGGSPVLLRGCGQPKAAMR